MILIPWHRREKPQLEESPGVQHAKRALAATNAELATAEGQRVVSQARRVTLAEIRRNNHFTPSIFPEAK